MPLHDPSEFHARQRAREAATLSPLACLTYPAERERPEPDAPNRTPLQRDRDRIVHSKAFRRLKQKTQVFVAPEGDHFRTRLTHTLEVTGIARTVARSLGLNEDLTEAIGVGHDLGHPPFGHIGEDVLDRWLKKRGGDGFRHWEHSVRIVERLEHSGRGLNLCRSVVEGIASHSGRSPRPRTLESAIVRVVDRIAYLTHDVDDAVRAGILDERALPANVIAVLGAATGDRIDRLVEDLVATSAAAGEIRQGEEAGAAMDELRRFMFEHVYLGDTARAEHARIEAVLIGLLDHYETNPDRLPAPWACQPDLHTRIVDWVAGMTDGYAVRTFVGLTVPRAFDPTA
ncbi:MAG: deoxyguanosinetriphosphate triphosphohydrolase [Solirubrobacteraceae bacterium]|nr:deoxyguanosinetriphosphate triphosphohydrolase [Solirubrobacteraceae bacterium]